MGHTLAELLEALIKALSHSGEYLPRLLPQMVRFAVRFLEVAALPQTLLVFLLSLAISVLGFGAWFLIHLLVVRLVHGRRKIFISYQHAHEPIALELADALAREGMQVTKLPFLDDPDHDELLDEVKRGIVTADIVLCLPGSRASFVENEISLAFGLSKPMVFFLAPSGDGRLPNTAKRGYPIFDLEVSRDDRWKIVTRFTGYLTRDLKSTLRLYSSVGHSLKQCVAALGFAYFVLVIASTAVIRHSPASEATSFAPSLLTEVQHPVAMTFFSITIAALAIPLALAVLSRHLLRRDIRIAASRRRFDVRLLPRLLGLGLTQEDLARVQFRGTPLAHHDDASRTSAQTSTAIRLNRGKLLLHGVGILLFSWFFWTFLGDGIFGHYDVFWCVLTLVVVLFAAYGLSLLYRIVVGTDLLLAPDGISQGTSRNQTIWIPWTQIAGVAFSDDGKILQIRGKSEAEATPIDLTYFRVDANTLLAIVNEYMQSAKTAARVGAEAVGFRGGSEP
ncbi:MAG TPA: toll/interleukin-1 receptor domain-containing protein [Thermoanaerobaculia bacterium]|nr:toll/interleukin-1 receptor domain-containing protein [Thermoanaerobaculia bacterium]